MQDGNLVVAGITLAILWTGSVIAVMIWLNAKFRHIEGMLYRELEKHRIVYDRVLSEHKERIIILELKAQGWSRVP